MLVHGLIAGCFVLFLVFLAAPLFDRFEAVRGESNLRNLPLPPETADIRYKIEITSVTAGAMELRGWAFVEGQDTRDGETYIVLKSNTDTYVFDTNRLRRTDVRKFIMEQNVGNFTGFLAILPLRKIQGGEYLVGILITRGDIAALEYMDQELVKSGADSKLILRKSRLQNIALPVESQGIISTIDACRVADEAGRKFVDITGWAFIEGQGSENSTTSLVLKSAQNTYIFDTILMDRPDVTSAYGKQGINLDHSGFMTRIPLEVVENDIYELGIYIHKPDVEALQYADNGILKSADAAGLTLRPARLQKLPLPPESKGVIFGIDTCVIAEEEGRKSINISGWAFIEGKSGDNGTTFLVLKSVDNTYIFDTVGVARPDVNAVYGKPGTDVQGSGFTTRIRRESVKQDVYQLGIYILESGVGALQYIPDFGLSVSY